jgi:hypothetical protein
MGAAADTFYLDKTTLLPIRRSSQQGMATIKLDYQPDAIKGGMKMGAQEMPIDVKLAAPVLGDNAALDVTLAALPLTADYQTTIRVFDLLSRKVRPMALKVTGTEKVDVTAGSFEAFKIELEPLDGEPGGSTIFVAKNAPHMMVRSEGQLPAMMGGGKITNTLNSFGLTSSK